MSRRRVAVVTGSRAEFGLLAPVMRAIEARPDLELAVFVTGMHLDPRQGRTADEVRRQFPAATELPAGVPPTTGADMARALSTILAGAAGAFERLAPDFVVVLGDRAEPMAAGLAAAYMRIPLAHIHGGDISRSGVDDQIRHALTQLANVHFAATHASADRIRGMGQAAWRIHVVGAPGLDEIRAARIATPEVVRARTGLAPGRPYVVVLHNPDLSRPTAAGVEIDAILEAVAGLDLAVVALGPNSDFGHDAIVDRLEAARRDGRIHSFLASLERPIFLGLVAGARALVGNTSSGLIEAPALGVPFVEVGTRQAGRERGANVLSAPAIPAAIREQVLAAHLDPEIRRRIAGSTHPYGDGRAGPRIAAILAEIDIDERLLVKELDLP